MTTLRQKVIHLAHEKPELRVHLLPLLIKTAAKTIAPDTLEVWVNTLNRLAQGLNFEDEEDRITFRISIPQATQNAKTSLIRDLIYVLGGKPRGSSREEMNRTLADTWITTH